MTAHRTKDVFAGSPSGAPVQIGLGMVPMSATTSVPRAHRRRIARRRVASVVAHARRKKRKRNTVVQVDAKGLIRAAESLSELLGRLDRHIETKNARKSLTIEHRRLALLPDCNADGSDITTLDQMSVLAGSQRKTVAYLVLDRHMRGQSFHPSLMKEARSEVRSNLESKTVMNVNGKPPTGVAIMALLSPEDAQRIAVPGGEPVNNLHVTLGYLEQPAANYTDLQRDMLLNQLLAYAPDLPIETDAFAFGVFNPNDTTGERDPCTVLLVQSQSLSDLHDGVQAGIENAGMAQSNSFPIWIPHVAVGYNMGTTAIDPKSLGPLTLDRVVVGWAGVNYDIATQQPIDDGNQTTEDKSLIRHVRTPGGQRRYGKPIGDVIVRNVVEQAVQHARTNRQTQNPVTVVLPHGIEQRDLRHSTVERIVKSDRMALRGKQTVHEVRDSKGRLLSAHVYLDGQYRATGEAPKDNLDPIGHRDFWTLNQLAQHIGAIQHTLNWKQKIGNVKYTRSYNGGVTAMVSDSEGMQHTLHIGTVQPSGFTVENPVTRRTLTIPKHNPLKDQNAVHRVIGNAVKSIENVYGSNPREAVPGNFMDYHREHADELAELAKMSTTKRLDVLEDKRAEMGTTAFGGNLSLETLETVVEALQTYNEAFPGFSRLINVISGVNKSEFHNPRTLADNRSVADISRDWSIRWAHDQYDSEFRDELDNAGHGGSWIRLSKELFGSKSAADDLVQTVKSNADAKWFSVNWNRIIEQNPDMQPDELARLCVFNHELGHTLVSVLTTFDDPSYDPVQAGHVKNDMRHQFLEAIDDHLKQWNVGSLPQSRIESSQAEWTIREEGFIDRDAMQLFLSMYGGKSIHEMCAEAWAEYQMDREPRLFARQIGELLEGALTDYLESLEIADKKRAGER